jgi:hypothetical protein
MAVEMVQAPLPLLLMSRAHQSIDCSHTPWVWLPLPLAAVQPWASYLTSLCFSFFFWNMVTIIATTSFIRFLWELKHLECSWITKEWFPCFGHSACFWERQCVENTEWLPPASGSPALVSCQWLLQNKVVVFVLRAVTWVTSLCSGVINVLPYLVLQTAGNRELLGHSIKSLQVWGHSINAEQTREMYNV